MDITYLLNSGFMIRDERILLVFDDYEDPAGIVDAVYNSGDFDEMYIFVSHAHFDHFGTHIRAYAPNVTKYIFSSDVKRTKRAKIFPTPKITYMRRYSYWEDDKLKVWTFDSTDVGVSFLVELPSGRRIFHAGDFNWWHWENDTPENIALAERIFKRQLRKASGIEADVVFFPIDGRLGAAQEKGALEFVPRTKMKLFVAMHRVDFPQWQPSPEFTAASKNVPTWAPMTPGERCVLDGEKFYVEA